MSIKIHLLPHLQHLSNGLNSVEVEGSTVGECLGHLIRQFPGIEKELFKKKGELANVIEIFVNRESTYPDELARTVQDGDEIYIIHVLGGG